MLRYHSFYAARRYGAYRRLMNERDEGLFEWVRKFNPYDLYSKGRERPPRTAGTTCSGFRRGWAAGEFAERGVADVLEVGDADFAGVEAVAREIAETDFAWRWEWGFLEASAALGLVIP